MENPDAESLPKGSIASTKKTPIHVLHVDDDAGYLKTAKMILEMQGSFHVETASSVEEAMEKIEEKTFDVIVCDCIMPGKDGLEFLKELRDGNNTIPFIIFTGKGREIVAIRALNLGADQYVNKIGKPEAVYSELAHGIYTVVKGKKAEEALRESEKEKIAILDSMSELVIHQDLKHRILWVNRKAADSVNMKAEQLKGRYCHELWANSANPCIDCPLEESIKTGQPQQGEMTLPDGRVWSISGYPIKDANGNVTNVVEVVTNITEQKKAEEELRKSEAKYRGLVENIGNGIATTDLEGRFVFVNQALCEMIGYSEKELIGKPFADFLHPDDKKKILQIFLDSWKNPSRKLSIEFRVIHKKGHIVHMYSSPTATLYKNKIVGFNAILSDITKRKLAEKALQESEEKYRRMVEQAPDSIITFDLNGVVTSCNTASVAMAGYSEDEVIGKHFSELRSLSEEDIQKFLKLLPSLLEGKMPEPFEIVYLKENGTPAFGEVHISLMKEGERITGFQAIMRDVTEQKKAAEALEKSEERYRAIVELSPDGILTANLKGTVTSVNKAFLDLTGFSEDEIVGKHFSKLGTLRARDLPKYMKLFASFLRGKLPSIYEFVYLHKDGSRRCGDARFSFIKKNGKTVGFQAVLRDTTEHKLLAEQLKESEQKYRKQFEEALDAIFVADAKTGIIIDCNRAATELVGRKKSELVGEHQQILHPPEEIEGEFSRTFKQHLKEKEGQILEAQVITKTGETRDVEIKANNIELDNKRLIQGAFRDITERKKAEEALRESEEKYRELLNGMNDTAWVIDFDGKFVDVNDAAVKVLGYSREELLSMGPPDIDTSLTAEEIRDLIKGMPADKIQVFETAHTTKDGKTIPVEISSSLVTYRGKQAILSIARDITERKKAEQKLNEMMNELVTINEKLGVIGKLTRHDARNKLSVIANNVYLAKQKLAADHTTLEYLGDIESAIDQMEELFDFAKTYEMLGVEELSYMNVEKSVNEAAILFSELTSVKLVNECQGLTVMADSLLRQLFYNLIDDTLKHGEKTSQIRAYYEEGEDQLKLIYEDDGIGIPNDEKEKIFKEGYGKGTGYGLYLIKKICETYGWTIQETGKPSKGAQFTITIPKTNKNGKISYIIN